MRMRALDSKPTSSRKDRESTFECRNHPGEVDGPPTGICPACYLEAIDEEMQVRATDPEFEPPHSEPDPWKESTPTDADEVLRELELLRKEVIGVLLHRRVTTARKALQQTEKNGVQGRVPGSLAVGIDDWRRSLSEESGPVLNDSHKDPDLYRTFVRHILLVGALRSTGAQVPVEFRLEWPEELEFSTPHRRRGGRHPSKNLKALRDYLIAWSAVAELAEPLPSAYALKSRGHRRDGDVRHSTFRRERRAFELLVEKLYPIAVEELAREQAARELWRTKRRNSTAVLDLDEVDLTRPLVEAVTDRVVFRCKTHPSSVKEADEVRVAAATRAAVKALVTAGLMRPPKRRKVAG
jgi:hypothetical protein